MSKAPTIGPTLNDLGVTRDESSTWQRIADISEDRFERFIAEAKENRRRGHGMGTAASPPRTGSPEVGAVMTWPIYPSLLQRCQFLTLICLLHARRRFGQQTDLLEAVIAARA